MRYSVLSTVTMLIGTWRTVVAGEDARRAMIERLFHSAGMALSSDDLDIVTRLHQSFAVQRECLTRAVCPEKEPMTIATFGRGLNAREVADDRAE